MSAAAVRIWAVASMTLKEAVRRKVFAILILFAVALLSGALFFPSIPLEGRLRLMEVWSLRAATLFTAIVGLFLAGYSLPSDFEQKRIYLLVSKPVSKPALFAGRFLGYVLLLAVFILTLGAVTILFLRGVQALSGPGLPPPVAYPRVEASAFASSAGHEIQGGGASHAAAAEDGSALVWTFRGLRPADYPETLRLQARLILGAEKDSFRNSGTVSVRAAGPGGRAHEQAVSMNTNEERDLLVPASAFGSEGTMTVEIRCADRDGRIGAARDWLKLYRKPMNFELSFLRGLALVLLQSVVVLSLTLMASTFLSAPLSILLGILLYVVGSVHGYIRDGTREIDRSLTEMKESPKHARHGPEELPEWVLRFSTTLSGWVLKVVPDFQAFDYSKWLLKNHAVSWRELGEAAAHALPPILVLGFLGTLVMAFKDFGA